MKRLGGVSAPSFTYEVGNPMGYRGRSWEMRRSGCAPTPRTATSACWAHADARVRELSGFPRAHPPLLPGEGEPCPAR